MTREKTSQEIVAEQIKKLPNAVREAILSVDYNKNLQEITKRQRLLIDQADKLEAETSLVMLGLAPITDYVSNLEKNLELAPARAKEVATDVNESIFKKIRASLEKMDEDMLSPDSKLLPSDEEDKEEMEVPVRFTNSNEADLNRDQILNEIENPNAIAGGDRTMDFTQPPVKTPAVTNQVPVNSEKTSPASTELEIRPSQELEIAPLVPVTKIKTDLLTTKMTSTNIVSQQVVGNKPEPKPVTVNNSEPKVLENEVIPEVKPKVVVKMRPSDGVDPYREPLI